MLLMATEDYERQGGAMSVVQHLFRALAGLDSLEASPGQEAAEEAARLPDEFNGSGQGPQPHRQDGPMHVQRAAQRVMQSETDRSARESHSAGQGLLTARRGT